MTSRSIRDGGLLNRSVELWLRVLRYGARLEGFNMRKIAISLLVVLSLWGATSWQQQPQWSVVHQLALTHQVNPISQTTIFTPTKAGLYRLNAYISGANSPDQWVLQFGWTDLSSAPVIQEINPQPSGVGWNQLALVFSVQPGTPVTFSVSGQPGQNAFYNLAFTVERLESAPMK